MSDGTIVGLYLVPGGTVGIGKWILRFVSPTSGKRREMGLGSYPTTTIRDARAKAFEARGVIDNGRSDDRRDRDEETARLAAVPTFEKAARLHHADRIEGFRNRKHIDQWINTLDQYVFPEIGKKLDNAGPADFAACLKPIEAAYHRTDLIDQRRAMMSALEAFCLGK